MRAIHVENPGPDYRLTVVDEPRPVPNSGEVLMRIAGAGLNRADLLQAQGRYPPPKRASPILGLEVSGEIVECGPGVAA
jgi:NADPH:quinone reductase-like Zn-dependent oxidoreductase